jgi:uncharacterized membrane protein SirB2
VLYLTIKIIHMSSVTFSFALFIFRGVLMMRDSYWLNSRILRIAPHVVDTLLLVSALWLTVLIRQYPFAQAWLTVKVVLLAVYIVLGSLALKRGRTKGQRVFFFIAASLTFLFIVSVARSHNPLGVLAPGLA